MRKLFLFALILLLLIISGCSNQRLFLNKDDLSVEKSILQLPDGHLEVKVNWELLPEIRIKNPTDLYYPPYLVIVPAEAGAWYHDNNSTDWMYYLSSLPSDVKRNVLNKIPDYPWEDNGRLRFGWEVSAKSFEQGSLKVMFRKAKDQSVTQLFQIYFIYYDPVEKKGWVKVI